MLPACRTEGEGFAIPTFALESSDVEGFMDVLQEFQFPYKILKKSSRNPPLFCSGTC